MLSSMAMAWTGASLETGMMTRAVFCSTSVEPLLGRTTSLAWYSLSRWTLRWRFSADLFLRLLSMAMPTLAASTRLMPAPTISSLVKPRPSLTLALYLKVQQLTTGRRAPAVGRGATWAALAARAARLASFGQIFLLRKWALGRTRLRWTAIFGYYFCKFD